MMTAYRFIRRLNDGSICHLGTAVQFDRGWRFIPNMASWGMHRRRRTSSKLHPTMEKCLPRWLGYPDRCESFAVDHEDCVWYNGVPFFDGIRLKDDVAVNAADAEKEG